MYSQYVAGDTQQWRKDSCVFGMWDIWKDKAGTEEANKTGDGELEGCGLNHRAYLKHNDNYREKYPWRFKKTQLRENRL